MKIPDLMYEFRSRFDCPITYYNDIILQYAVTVLDVAVSGSVDPVGAGEDDGGPHDDARPVHVGYREIRHGWKKGRANGHEKENGKN
jgi:hypothetical protein